MINRRKEAGLSPGATIPALQRLLETGFVRPGKSGLRGRTEHRVTSAGRKHLVQGWNALIADGPTGDLDTDLRVALLALWIGGERKLAVDFLRQSAEKIQKLMQAVSGENSSDGASPLGDQYRALRGSAAKALLKAHAISVTSIVESISTKSPRRHKTRGRRSSTKRS